MGQDPQYYFQISTSSGVPIYRQVIDQVKTLIATGHLVPEMFLPSVRQVAKALAVNPMTVSKAYSLLEKEGVLECVRGQGMRVKSLTLSEKNLDDRKQDIVPIIKQMITKAHQLSLGPEDIQQLIEKEWKENSHE